MLSQKQVQRYCYYMRCTILKNYDLVTLYLLFINTHLSIFKYYSEKKTLQPEKSCKVISIIIGVKDLKELRS